jgi:hypothetical protein
MDDAAVLQAATPPPLPPRRSNFGQTCRCAPHPQAVHWQKALADRTGWAEEIEDRKQLSLRIFSGTWNVAGKMLDTAAALGEWLGVDPGSSATAEGQSENGGQPLPPHIFAIGFQEVLDTFYSVTAMLL